MGHCVRNEAAPGTCLSRTRKDSESALRGWRKDSFRAACSALLVDRRVPALPLPIARFDMRINLKSVAGSHT